MAVVDVNNLKNGRKLVKLQKESPTGYAGEGKQSKGNDGINIKPTTAFCEEESVTSRKCEVKIFVLRWSMGRVLYDIIKSEEKSSGLNTSPKRLRPNSSHIL